MRRQRVHRRLAVGDDDDLCLAADVLENIFHRVPKPQLVTSGDEDREVGQAEILGFVE
jgi:hypothetical protein